MALKASDGNGNVRRHPWSIITGYLPIVTHFCYLFVFVVLVSIMEGYLSAGDHILLAQF